MDAAVWLNHVLLAGLVYPWSDNALRHRDLPRYMADVLYASMLSLITWLIHGLDYTMLAAMWASLMSWTRIEQYMGNWKDCTLLTIGSWPNSLRIAALGALAIVIYIASASPLRHWNLVVLLIGAIMAGIQCLSCRWALFSKTQLHVHHYQIGLLFSLMVTTPVMQGLFLGMMMHGLLHYGGDPSVERLDRL